MLLIHNIFISASSICACCYLVDIAQVFCILFGCTCILLSFRWLPSSTLNWRCLFCSLWKLALHPQQILEVIVTTVVHTNIDVTIIVFIRICSYFVISV